MKVSACVECGTTILGDRLRCPACHDEHARELVEDAITAPRARQPSGLSLGQSLLAWFVLLEVAVSAVLVGVLAARGC